MKMGLGNLVHLGREYRSGPNFYRDWKERPLAINTLPDGTICIASVPSGKGIDVLHGGKCEIYLYPDGTYSADILKSWYCHPAKDAMRLEMAGELQMAPPHYKLPWED